MKVYGVSVSYYTGKLEAYLRYKGLFYEMHHPYADQRRIKQLTGAIQVPMVERDDGRWMSDSTPILLQLEKEHRHATILPSDPVVRFIAMLMEDYADEWLWRAAMHYRWSYEHDRELLSRILADEITNHLKLPRFLRLRMLKRRQRTSFVIKDGVTDTTRDHVEGGYHAALANMTRMLVNRPFLLGNSPSIADFGFMGPMLRHFGQDPTPAEIMRNEGPVVFDWLSRVWNTRGGNDSPSFLEKVPDDAMPMLKEVCETHLVQLRYNALAFGAGKTTFDTTVQGCDYRNLPVSRYRVYCLEQLRQRFKALDPDPQQAVQAMLNFEGADILWCDNIGAESNYDEAGEAPFNKAINVYGTGVPA